MLPIKKPSTGKKRGPGRPIQKGQVLNPHGARTHNKEIKAVKALTKSELAEVGNYILRCSADEIEQLSEDPTANVLQLMVCSIAARCVRKGDTNAFDTLMNRLVGKVKDEVHHTGEGTNVSVNVSLPSNGREAKTG